MFCWWYLKQGPQTEWLPVRVVLLVVPEVGTPDCYLTEWLPVRVILSVVPEVGTPDGCLSGWPSVRVIC